MEVVVYHPNNDWNLKNRRARGLGKKVRPYFQNNYSKKG
jgi:hypothetical protein